jgi:hypothetical protein
MRKAAAIAPKDGTPSLLRFDHGEGAFTAVDQQLFSAAEIASVASLAVTKMEVWQVSVLKLRVWTYASIAPIILPFVVVYFFLGYIVLRRNSVSYLLLNIQCITSYG